MLTINRPTFTLWCWSWCSKGVVSEGRDGGSIRWFAPCVRRAKETLVAAAVRRMPLACSPCDRVVDPNFSKLVSDVQLVIAGVIQRMDQLKLEQKDAAEACERQIQQIQMPEMESLCHEIRTSGDKLIAHVNETVKQLMTAITTSISNEMRRVMRSVADDCLKSLTGEAGQCDDDDNRSNYLIRSHIDQINHRLRHISHIVFSLNQQNGLLSHMEQQLGLDPGQEDRCHRMQQLLQSSLWSGQQPFEMPIESPNSVADACEEIDATFPDLCQSPVHVPQSSPATTPEADKSQQQSETPQSATKDRTFAEILSDGENSFKNWEKKSSAERKSV